MLVLFIYMSLCAQMSGWLRGYKSKLGLSPLLSSWRLGPIPSLVVLGLHVRPISGKDGSSTGLEALDHGPPLLLITLLVDLFEQHRSSIFTVLLVVIEHISLNLLVELVPVVLYLGTGGVVEFVLLYSLRDAQAVPPQEGPGFSVDLLLHDDLDAVELEVEVGLDTVDLLEEGEIQFIGASVVGNGELNKDSILMELDDEIFFFLNGVGDFKTHLCWGLVPRILIALRIAQDFVLQHILLPQLDDRALVQGRLPRLLATRCQLNTHNSKSNIIIRVWICPGVYEVIILIYLQSRETISERVISIQKSTSQGLLSSAQSRQP